MAVEKDAKGGIEPGAWLAARGATWQRRRDNRISVRFNPRARAGRDTTSPRTSSTCTCFNPRARAGRDSLTPRSLLNRRSFNPRARAGRDGNNFSSSASTSCFNPRARAGRDYGAILLCYAYTSFNPRARAGRDIGDRAGRVRDFVSIHAPVRGATTVDTPFTVPTMFQSTRPCGARPVFGGVFKINGRFQSTRPCGARPHRCLGFKEGVVVSIHAPVRGATQCLPLPPRSARVSIHAPVRGATDQAEDRGAHVVVSIHAPVRGATVVRPVT